jgi:hypothetical protein
MQLLLHFTRAPLLTRLRRVSLALTRQQTSHSALYLRQRATAPIPLHSRWALQAHTWHDEVISSIRSCAWRLTNDLSLEGLHDLIDSREPDCDMATIKPIESRTVGQPCRELTSRAFPKLMAAIGTPNTVRSGHRRPLLCCERARREWRRCKRNQHW